MKPIRALSIRQPYAELIICGVKKVEYRPMLTNIRERVYIYATKRPGHPDDWAKMKMKPGDLPSGVIIGTVEVCNCSGEPGDYKWHLKNPKRLRKHLIPINQPQPSWFRPF